MAVVASDWQTPVNVANGKFSGAGLQSLPGSLSVQACSRIDERPEQQGEERPNGQLCSQLGQKVRHDAIRALCSFSCDNRALHREDAKCFGQGRHCCIHGRNLWQRYGTLSEGQQQFKQPCQCLHLRQMIEASNDAVMSDAVGCRAGLPAANCVWQLLQLASIALPKACCSREHHDAEETWLTIEDKLHGPMKAGTHACRRPMRF